MGARIVAIADAFDAMTTNRPYSPARTLELAYQEILDCTGARYDPEIVLAFSEMWEANQIHEIAANWQSTAPAI